MMHFRKLSGDREPLTVACSGGPDSMAALHFLSQKHEVYALYVNHRTDHAAEAQDHVVNWCLQNGIPVGVAAIEDRVRKRESMEQFWHNERYRIFQQNKRPVITAHNLDDCVENWLMTSLTGNPVIIREQNQNVFRPFMRTTKQQILDYVHKHDVPYVIDQSNYDTTYKRNYIRRIMVPMALEYNPGLFKVIEKKVREQYESNLRYR